MAAPTYADFERRFPTLAALVPVGEDGANKRDLIEEEIEEAWEELDGPVWTQKRRDKGALLQAAHAFALRESVTGAEAKQVLDSNGNEVPAQISIGSGWSASRASQADSSIRLWRAGLTASGNDSWWALTSWGMQWLELRDRMLSQVQFDGVI